ncbi:hypothetical protein HAPAU_03020 [Halalkalicoccus paucihalophilus]|uniref:Uncharacterized protein n=1 Tax=Halalkalicoccus paucihalophilus TaxID=1008153 RepID=A0A151AJ49_9EURY|nr:hypothetical protein HAPAU_03020 [Halalkalicoccus paucihalophilus]
MVRLTGADTVVRYPDRKPMNSYDNPSQITPVTVAASRAARSFIPLPRMV